MSMSTFKVVHAPSITRISFASRSKFKICLLKGGMSSKEESLSKEESSSIKPSGEEKFPRTGVVNVYGKPGCGKTTFFSKRVKHISFDHEILKSKERTCDFLDMMRYSLLPLVLDDYELIEGSVGLKELRPLRVPLYIVSTNKITNIECITCHYEFPGVSVEDFARTQNISVDLAKELLEKANGNMHTVKLDLENFKSERDIFVSSKEYVEDLVCRRANVTSFLDKHLSEHGNTFGIIHENYPDFCDCMEVVSQSLSDADLIDRAIYSDMSWELMPFFNVSACLVPALHFSSSSDEPNLRPASIWTKTSNMLMKRNRLKKLPGRVFHTDFIPVLVQKMNAGEDAPKQFSSYDLDSVNQLSFTKIKPKILTSLKKKCPRKE